jgi:putative endonuclease
MAESSTWMVYILECSDTTFYTGITTDVHRRFAAHQAGKGGKYTRSHTPIKVVYTEHQPSRSEASKREAIIKQLTRNQKMQLVEKYKEQT